MLADLHAAICRASSELASDSPWARALNVLAAELEDGQPFFFRFALASSSRSKSETVVASE